MTASVSMPVVVVYDGDGGMVVRTSSKEVVVANNGAKRVVLVHIYHRNCAAQGHSDENAGPVGTAVAETHEPATSLDRDNGDKANNVDRPTLMGISMPCL